MKKRILSLILALSMVLSVLPLGAFAADPPELVMKDGLPDCSNGTSGNGWDYDSSTDTLTLNYGAFDFSSTHPQNKTGTQPAPAVKCAIESGATISGGTFAGSVTNNDTIEKGTFEGKVTNNSTISGGTFNGTVINNATGDITGGTFQSTCSVTNTGIIKDGIFTIKVENGGIGEIFGGIFAAGLSRNDGNVAGGVFNGNATITGVRGLHSITWDTAYPNAKITKVNDVSADWKPYVVIDEMRCRK